VTALADRERKERMARHMPNEILPGNVIILLLILVFILHFPDGITGLVDS
jgi:hypothetical protein